MSDVLTDALEATFRVVRVFERLRVRYVVGGSLASSLHGIPRSTQDVDLVAELRTEHVDAFVASLAADFYVDAAMIHDAIFRRSSFNVIFLATMFKVDVFVPRASEVTRAELDRGQVVRIADDPSTELVVASPEDTVAQKLAWYRIGGETSDRQWADVQGVLRVKGTSLDMAYLRQTAAALGIGDVLERALDAAGL